MPLPLQTLVRHHHNPDYCGPQQPLTLLAGLADHLLGSTPAGLGPAPAEATTLALMRRLELEPDACREAFGKIVASGALKT